MTDWPILCGSAYETTPCGISPAPPENWYRIMAVHYPRRTSRIKRARSIGFRARMKTKNGRKIIRRQRRIGRKIS
jgi:large subunit ribosomal protein L34